MVSEKHAVLLIDEETTYIYQNFIQYLNTICDININCLEDVTQIDIIIILKDINKIEVDIIKNFRKTIVFFIDTKSLNSCHILDLCHFFDLKLGPNVIETCSLNSNKSFHPKECVIHFNFNDFVLFHNENNSLKDINYQKFSFIYPYGISLNEIGKNCSTLLSTGIYAYPQNAAIFTLSTSSNDNSNKVFCIGSKLIFADTYIHLYQNILLIDKIFNIVFGDVTIQSLKEHSQGKRILPNISALSADIKYCNCLHIKPSVNAHGEFSAGIVLDVMESINSLQFIEPIVNYQSKALPELYRLAADLNVDFTLPPKPLRPRFKRFYPPLQMMLHPASIPFPKENLELPKQPENASTKIKKKETTS